jgi:diguanylate cyclase (GGDEF)-like protein/PAS domain S-box-containing protein
MQLRSLLATVHGRFLLLALTYGAMLLLLAIATWQMVGEATNQSQRALGSYHNTDRRIMGEMREHLAGLEKNLYRYATLLDEAVRREVDYHRYGLNKSLRELKQLAIEEGYERVADRVDEGLALAQKIDIEVNEVLTILSTAEGRYPGVELVLNHLYPTHMAMIAAIDRALVEARSDNEGAGEERELWHELRYAWVQSSLALRTFMANRAGIFGAPQSSMAANQAAQQNWLERFNSLLATLDGLEGEERLGLTASESLLVIHDHLQNYPRLMEQIRAIYSSEHWRNDLLYFRNQLQPTLLRMQRYHEELDQLVFNHASDGVLMAIANADRLVYFLGLVLLVMLLLTLAGYRMFARYISQPMDEITTAMAAAGRGEHVTFDNADGLSFVANLQHAFAVMQSQIRNRENRLSSLLANISDGIITINNQGMIETFNPAAERLFGYSASEVIGENVNILMPPMMARHHDRFISNYQKRDESRIIDREREEIAQRKDGSAFHISLRISEFSVDGERRFSAVVSDISERKQAMQQLRDLADRDSLTRLFNRRYFVLELGRAIDRARRGDTRIALLYIDLDNFKYVNDTMGHQAGDRVLVEVTELLASRVRRGDLIARLGGDEFAVLLYDQDRDTAVRVAEIYRGLLASYRFVHGGEVVDVGCSIGVACYEHDMRKGEDLLARADLACHIAKSNGRNRVHLFDPASQAELNGMSIDMGWARRIKDALEYDGLVLHYQPIVDARSRRPRSWEALIRMRNGDELLPPSAFLPAAERFGLMVDIDRWVVTHALSSLARLAPDQSISINLSANTLEQPESHIWLVNLLNRYSNDAHRITFEVTETTAITRMARALELIGSLKKLGVSVALDDFGTGYASFAYLRELPVDSVKIDGAFIQRIDQDEVLRVMVQSMVEVARVMGKKSVAEFVGSEAIAEILAAMGVDLLQGYHLGKPVSLDAVLTQPHATLDP